MSEHCEKCNGHYGDIKCALCGGYFCDRCIIEDFSGNIVCIDCYKREI